MSMGQWLCVPMVLAGVALWFWGGRRGRAAPASPRAEVVSSEGSP